MAKKKKKYGQYAAVCVVAAAVGLGVFGWLNDFEFGDFGLPFGSESSANGTDNGNNAIDPTAPPESDGNITPTQPEESDDNGNTGSQVEVPRLIEVYNDRIIFDGNDITLDELNDILTEHGNNTDVWELHDIHQASVAVYSAIIDLFQQHNVMLAER